MFLGSIPRPARKADNLTAIYEPTVQIMSDPQHLKTLCATTAGSGESFIFLSADHVRTLQKTHLWAATACHGGSFVFYM
jgi:hypothetical protein